MIRNDVAGLSLAVFAAAEAPPGEIIDIKPLQPVAGWSPEPAIVLPAAAVAALLALLAWALIRRRRRRRSAAAGHAAEAVPAGLCEGKTTETEDDRQFYFFLTACVRRHLAKRFRMRTAAATTPELLAQLSGRVSSGAAWQEFARRLEDADRFRFGGLEAGPERRRRDLLFFQNFITESFEGAAAADGCADGERAPLQDAT